MPNPLYAEWNGPEPLPEIIAQFEMSLICICKYIISAKLTVHCYLQESACLTAHFYYFINPVMINFKIVFFQVIFWYLTNFRVSPC